LVRLTAHTARGRLGFRFSSRRVFQARPQLEFRFGTPRAFQPRPLGLGRARSWGSRVEIAKPALSKGRANGRCNKAAQARRARRRLGRCRVKVHCPSVAAAVAGLPIKRWKAQRGALVASRPRAEKNREERPFESGPRLRKSPARAKQRRVGKIKGCHTIKWPGQASFRRCPRFRAPCASAHHHGRCSDRAS
jgi:hypothetical protein